ncbi:hypothetical protein EDC02_0839 [Micromonospora sp. Llam0]|uniref:hypothetical protein n=1 Tax=Micromonospora sp. Llam0 TaxID=2485143 RepID=UPI000F46273F|nr:hypothetical protein [Micromonospora sp. Llam0]ROO59054.1 hypothetical protein EDC02_0839 [Micromonospora sp. Llam0]
MLQIDQSHVALRTDRGTTTAAHRGITEGIRNAVADLRRARARHMRTAGVDDDHQPSVTELLKVAAERLAEEFLPAQVNTVLSQAITGAESDGAALRLGLLLSDDLAAAGGGQLPWEALPELRSSVPLA